MKNILQTLGIQDINPAICTGMLWSDLSNGVVYKVHSPIDNSVLASVEYASSDDYDHTIATAQKASVYWRNVPAPKRGEVVRQIGNKLRENKELLGKLVSMESGKILQEGLGEVQEMIDICDFAVGLSRQLQGSTMHSERPEHRMYDQYHPLGIVGIISAFNFPVAVWAWNAMLAAVCGNVSVWKPSEKTPLTAIACHKILADVLYDNGIPEGVFNLIIGDRKIGEAISKDTNVALVSATGSTAMGKKVAVAVANRLGKSLLELGGNNAIIITPHANLELAIRAVVFGAVGTAGQRCTSTRRVIIHESVFEKVKMQLLAIYPRLPIGNPLEDGILVGPLIDKQAVEHYSNAINAAIAEGGKVLYGGGKVTKGDLEKGNYVQPTIIEAKNSYQIVQDETFAPILYLISYEGEIENAIHLQNDVKQGLSSAIFSNLVQETEKFLAQNGSDCGIANVNIGTSGAEIGGAFGGEKETGGGRESGSDAWKAYMRRQTNTINYSGHLPLAQGIRFDV